MPTKEVETIKRCPISHLKIETDVKFFIQRDDSRSSSTIRYWRIDLQQFETFSFASGYSDHTHVTYDGLNLKCVGNSRGHHKCNKLPRGRAVPAVVVSIDFNPRRGSAYRNQWQRNRYNLVGSYHRSICNPEGTDLVLKATFGPLNRRNENRHRTKVKFVNNGQIEMIKECPKSQLNINTNIFFYIQRDDSKSSSIFRYWRFDSKKFENFSFNRGYSDHTRVTYDGHNLKCVGNRRGHHQCNRLPRGVAVPAVVVSIDFQPRRGSAHRNDWNRNRYTIRGSYYHTKCSSTK